MDRSVAGHSIISSCIMSSHQHERRRGMTHPLDGTPDALVSESNSVKTKALLWCVGATAGSRMMSTNVPMICHTVEVPFQRARKRVGRKLMSACRNRMTAGHSQQAFRVPRPPRGLSLGQCTRLCFHAPGRPRPHMHLHRRCPDRISAHASLSLPTSPDIYPYDALRRRRRGRVSRVVA